MQDTVEERRQHPFLARPPRAVESYVALWADEIAIAAAVAEAAHQVFATDVSIAFGEGEEHSDWGLVFIETTRDKAVVEQRVRDCLVSYGVHVDSVYESDSDREGEWRLIVCWKFWRR